MNSLPPDLFAAEILVVDDTPNNLRLLSTMLTEHGYQVRKALNGQMALASVEASLPDIILLDIKMPQMDGYEVCQRLKANVASQDIPVIFISALDDALDKVKAFSVGGVDYVTKPFQTEEVLARIANHLRLRSLQTQLLQQNQELLRTNRELERFTSTVSHDLQQPLQSIIGFAQLLVMKYEDGLDEDAQHYLERIMSAGNRMQRLVHDLLTYARLGKQALDFQAIDCGQILGHVENNLQAAIKENQVILLYEDLPVVMADEIHLMQLFQNLVSNATKFLRSGVQPEVRIFALQKEHEWMFGVKDNGIGIESDCLERIFEVFQRSPNVRQVPGHGIGLATCKKIVEMHNGRIWVESQAGVGTTFYFTLPSSLPTYSETAHNSAKELV